MATRKNILWQPVLIPAILIVLCMLSLRPFLVNSGLPTGNDTELHVFRTAELGYSKAAGQIYPRWAPNFFHGYGYPIFNYYAPLSYHLGYWFSFGHPENAVAGTLVVTVLAQCWGIIGAYLLGKSYSNEGGGLIAAAVFAFSPYIQFINPHIRGDIAEVVALDFVPWAFWAWSKVWKSTRFRYVVIAVLFPAMALLTHNLTGLITVLLLVVFSVWQWIGYRAKIKTALRACLTGLSILALTAFFWLPFFSERNAILLNVAGDGHYDFRNHFVTWTDLISPLAKLDWTAATPQFPMSAGSLNVLLLLIGLVFMLWEVGKWKRLNVGVSFFILASACLIFLVSPDSVTIWNLVPGIEYFQFPWRFLGPFCVLMTPVAAYSSTRLGALVEASHRKTIYALLLILPLALGTPGMFLRPWESLPTVISPDLVLSYELRGLWRGTTSTNDFVPATVEMIPGPQPELLDSIRSGTPDRVNRYTLPDDVTVTVVQDKPWVNHFTTIAGNEFLLRLYIFDFPGWTAKIDGVPVDIEIAHPEGFITLQVPGGSHDVVLAFEDTFVRQLGWGISIISCFGFAAMGINAALNRRRNVRVIICTKKASTDVSSLYVGLLTLIVVGSIVFFTRQAGVFYVVSPVGQAVALPYQQDANLSNQIALLGYDLSHEHLSRGSILEIDLAWQALQPMENSYQSFIHVIDSSGNMIQQSDHLNPGGFPTQLWPTDRYVIDTHRIILPDDTPAGELRIYAGIFDLDTGKRLSVIDSTLDRILLDTIVTVR